MSFTSLGLIPALAQAVAKRGYAQPTPIQEAAIPRALQGADVLGQAQTGSGKTAAFALPLLQIIEAKPRLSPRPLRGLVLVPTRELAAQVGETLHALAQGLTQPLRVAVVYGGVSINPQMMALRGGADIVVATPGRLLDLIEHNAVKLSKVGTLVLDEADRLLDLGFAEELARILALLPAERQNLFFSATFPPAVQALADGMLHEPERISIAATPAAKPDIAQRAILTDTAKRTPLLRQLIKEHGWDRVLVFVATKYSSEHVADKLRRNGIAAEALHGELSQGARTQVLEDFKAGRLQVLLATDLAARGIDVVQLAAVVNYDLPRSTEDYTHRIGRTGRAGASGTAISFVCPDTEPHMRLIEKRQQLQLARESIPGYEATAAATALSTSNASSTASGAGIDPNGGIKGKRKSKKDKLREAAAKAGS
jgi:superfamily II DNA/RNA helicase